MTLGNQKIKVVAAIDFGTSRSGYAYAFKDNQRIIGRYQWDKQPFSYIKTLTQSLYDEDRELKAWGYAALSEFAGMRRDKNAKDYSFFPTFKMALREGKRTDEGPIATAHNGENFPVIDLIADYLRELGGLLRQELDNNTSGELKDDEILWCLTIPAIWKDDEKSFMRMAAIQAGLITNQESDRDRLLLVLEPEAAAIYCREKDKSQLKTGTCFMIVDCGGGTIDITVHQVSSHGGLDEVAAGTGGAYGSKYVDKEFLEHLKSQLDTQALASYQKNDPIGWLELMANWERKKCDFDPITTTTTYFDIPNGLYKILSKDYPEILERLAEEQDEDDERVHIDRETMQAFFEPVLEGLVETIEEQFQILDDYQCDILYLVGGFSTSPVLRQRIQQEFEDRIKIVMPAQPGAAIVEGAAAFGMNPDSIRSRRSRLTYGCDVRDVFDEKLDLARKSDRQEDLEKKEYYMSNRFSSFITAGQSVGIDEVITKSFVPSTAAQTAVAFTFYATKKENPRYVDETDVQEIGKIRIDISSTVGTEDRSIEASMNFGKTEITVTVKDVQTGGIYKTNLQFSSTYSIESSWQGSDPITALKLFDDLDTIPF